MAKKGSKKRSSAPSSGISSSTWLKIGGGAAAILLLFAAIVWPSVSRMLERMRVTRAEKAVIAALDAQAELAAKVTDRDSATAVARDYGALQSELLASLEHLKGVRTSSSMATEEMAQHIEKFEESYDKAEQPVRGAELKMPPDAWLALKGGTDAAAENQIATLRGELLPKRQALEVAQKERQAGFQAEMKQRREAATLGPPSNQLGQLGGAAASPQAGAKPAAPVLDPTIGTIPGSTITLGPGAKPAAQEVPLDHLPESDFLKENAERAVTVTVLGIDSKQTAVIEKLMSKVGVALQSPNLTGQSGDGGRYYVFVELEDFAATSNLSSVGEIVKSFPEKRLVILKVKPAEL
jgi:hypothetical protein